jgi:DNA repair protein RecN (Recombination protein N)
MLLRLDIENIAIIKKSTLTFGAGLTVFTGQTGAGKSILLDALSLCLGARADTDLIRHGEDRAVISAVFNIDQRTFIYELLSEHGIPIDTAELVIRRILVRDGNSRCFLNDYPVSLNLIKLVANYLMEIHQQFDRILDTAAHRSVLDEYAQYSELLTNTKNAFQLWKQAVQTLEEEQSKIAAGLREKEFLEHKVKELSDFSPKFHEEETLTEQRTFIKQKQSIINTYNSVIHTLNDDIKTLILQIHKALGKLEDPVSVELCESIDQVLSNIIDISATAEEQLHTIDQVGSLEDIEDRLFELRHLARKYNCTADELPAILGEAVRILEAIDASSSNIKRMEADVKTTRQQFINLATESIRTCCTYCGRIASFKVKPS